MFQTVCKVQAGLTEEQRLKFTESLPRWGDSHPPWIQSRLKSDVWLEPSQVWEITGSDVSISSQHTAGLSITQPKEKEKGISVRFPRFIRVRTDKRIDDCSTSDMFRDYLEKFFKGLNMPEQK